MQTRLFRQIGLIALLCVTLVSAACAKGTTSSSSSTTTTAKQLQATLNGAGATFPKAFYEEVIAAFKKVQPKVTVNYAGGGSGNGRQQLQDKVVDFAGSDGLVKPEDVPKYKGGEFLYVPTVAGPITVSYNLPDVKTLKLSPDTIAAIFQRDVKTWDAAPIKADNPGVALPSTAITVVHRADSSGTTENFTKFLVAAAPTTWKLKSGSTVEWPADTEAGTGNAGVASTVKSTSKAGQIGYVDLSDAKAAGLQTAQVKNKAGKFVAPTVAGAEAAVAGTTVNADLTYNPLWVDGDQSYPITAPTWILLYKNQTDHAKGEALVAFLKYLLTDGEGLANSIDFAKLPTSLRDQALAQLDKVVIPPA